MRRSESHAPPGAEFGDDPAIASLLARVNDRFGPSVLGVVVYGSYLRGERDTLIDFYVLLASFSGAFGSRWQEIAGTVLPPNVYYLNAGEARCKCTVMCLEQLERAVASDFHPYFWARFCQPFAIAQVASRQVRERLEALRRQAVRTFLTHTYRGQSDAREVFVDGFALTYRCEIRPESGQRAEQLYRANAEYFDTVFAEMGPPPWPRSGLWRWRAFVGKMLSVLRIVKAGLTFDDPLDYVVWKTERHSGVRIEPTDRQRRYPLIFGWSLLWKLYRRGGFR
ncbi:MAG: hypothetical protein O7H39_12120 [Gammaproteobacteria bacterium]|nr:hypothetical protein [Gammaproteobacteria bacterium]